MGKLTIAIIAALKDCHNDSLKRENIEDANEHISNFSPATDVEIHDMKLLAAAEAESMETARKPGIMNTVGHNN